MRWGKKISFCIPTPLKFNIKFHPDAYLYVSLYFFVNTSYIQSTLKTRFFSYYYSILWLKCWRLRTFQFTSPSMELVLERKLILIERMQKCCLKRTLKKLKQSERVWSAYAGLALLRSPLPQLTPFYPPSALSFPSPTSQLTKTILFQHNLPETRAHMGPGWKQMFHPSIPAAHSTCKPPSPFLPLFPLYI